MIKEEEISGERRVSLRGREDDVFKLKVVVFLYSSVFCTCQRIESPAYF